MKRRNQTLAKPPNPQTRACEKRGRKKTNKQRAERTATKALTERKTTHNIPRAAGPGFPCTLGCAARQSWPRTCGCSTGTAPDRPPPAPPPSARRRRNR
eukprot:1669951-Rhodomonas_salina.1